MKLALAALAALTIAGCATDNDGEGGAHLDGLRPAKPSLDETPFGALNQNVVEYLNRGGLSFDLQAGNNVSALDSSISIDQITDEFPIYDICQACDDGVIQLTDNRFPDEIHLVDKFGNFFCTMWVEQGRVVNNNCR